MDKTQEKLSLLPDKIDALVFDFDGVFTDNKVLINEAGEEFVLCSRGDGMGITLLKETKLPLLIISKEKNIVVQKRAEKLGIEALNGIDNKLPELESWLKTKNLKLENTIYVGNDVNDIECLKAVACSVVVADTHPSTLPYAKMILEHKGGNGAVREICDLVLEKVGKGL